VNESDRPERREVPHAGTSVRPNGRSLFTVNAAERHILLQRVTDAALRDL
jgi:hypothetical protein